MIHSYSTDVALAVGGVPEAVMLKEIAYWCMLNKEKGVNEHDGRYWTFISQREWMDRFPEFNARGALSKLRSGGWLLTENFNDNPWDHTLWYALSNKTIALLEHIDLLDSDNRSAETNKSYKTIKTSGKTSLEEIQKKNADIIDRLYSLYPTKRDGGASTGKCARDKTRIAGLLRDYSPEQIERSIRKYVEETDGRYYKNFSTFLNNMPEYEDDTVPTLSKEDRLRALGYQ